MKTNGSRFTARGGRALALLTLLAALAPAALAQADATQYDRGTPPQHAAGVTSFGSYASADLGTVNLSNGALNFKLPLGQVGGRGFRLPLTLNYSSKVWSAATGTDYVNEPIYRTYKAAYAVYDSDEAAPDIYQRLAPGWTLGVAPTLRARGQGLGPSGNTACGGDYLKALTKLTVMLPDKGEVELRDDLTDGSPLGALPYGPNNCRVMDGNRGQRWHSTDGSGIVFISDAANGVVNGSLTGWLVTADGARYRFEDATPWFSGSVFMGEVARATSVTDRNGNQALISYSTTGPLTVTFTDQLRRVTTVEYGVTDPATGELLAARVTADGYQGQPRQYKLKTGVMNQNYRADISPVLPVYNGWVPGMAGDENCGTAPAGSTLLFASWCGGAERLDDKQVLTELVLPDGRSLRFRYNEYGEVAEAELPTGARLRYDYAYEDGLPAGYSPAYEVNASPGPGNVYQIDRAVKARRTYPDGVNVEGNWSYEYTATRGTNGDASAGVAEVTAKAADNATVLARERHYFLDAARFQTSTGGTGYALWSTGLERRSESLDAAGAAVLAASEQDWAQRAPVVWTNGYTTEQVANDNRVGESRRHLDDGKVSKVTYLYDQFNNITDSYEYDYGAGAAGALLRRTHTDYVTAAAYVNADPSPSAGAALRRLPLRRSVYDAAGVEQARTAFEYDNYAATANHAALTARASISGFDASYTASFQTRGNATATTASLLTNGTVTGSVSTYAQYDVAGNVTKSIDGRGNAAAFGYSDCFGAPDANARLNSAPPELGGLQSYAFVTSTTNALGQVSYAQYDYYLGRAVDAEDANGVVSSSYFNDVLDRPSQVVRAASHASVRSQTTFVYDDLNRVVTETRDRTAYGDNLLKSQTLYDGLGRATQGRAYETAAAYVTTKTVYDALGRVRQVSNPYRAGDAVLYNSTAYNLLGRVTAVTSPDGAAATTVYAGNRVTVTDQAGNDRESTTDALGRLTQVLEDPGAGGLGYVTTYAYDVLDNLRTVTQGAQTRSFTYDSLGRLTSAASPESGTTSYLYDNNGNMTRRTDARSVQTNVTYDALNRPASKTYTDATPAVAYYYDNQALPAGAPSFTRGASVGGLVGVTYGGASSGSYYGYDALGRALTRVQQTDGVNYVVDATYNLAGALATEIYPAVPGYTGTNSRRVVTYSFDQAGRISSLSAAATTYSTAMAGATVNAYAAHGALSMQTLGNSLIHQVGYNTRLQPTTIRLGTGAAPASVLSLTYNYGAAANNGNVLDVTEVVGAATIKQLYSYDALNRLAATQETNGSTTTYWTETNGYDRYGNRWEVVNGSPSLIFGANNRIAGANYDAAGNLLGDGAHNYGYDAENHITTVDGVAGVFRYDGEGRRVRKEFAAGERLRLVYDAAGRVVAEYSSVDGSLKKEYVYGAEGLLATIEAGPTGARYLTADQLGTPRVVTGAGGAVVSRHDYTPFGEELQAGTGGRTAGMGYVGASDGLRQKFTGYARDAETGLDYAQARYFASWQGRFTSADPLFIGAQRLPDPQLLNIYAYARNNPLKYADPTGLDVTLEGTQQQEYINDINKRDKHAFTVANIDNKVRIVDAKGNALDKAALESLGKTLSGGEKELFNAITDDRVHAVIDTGDGKPNADIDFGGSNAKIEGDGRQGRNTLDISDINLLNSGGNKGAVNVGNIFAHETLEAYATARGTDPDKAHIYAAQYFGEFQFMGSRNTGRPDFITGAFHAGEMLFNAVSPKGTQTMLKAKVEYTRGFLPGQPGTVPHHIRQVEVVP